MGSRGDGVNSQMMLCRKWNYYDYEGLQTNNHIEGWHARLNKVVGKAHPNILEVFEVMKKEQASSEMKLEQMELGWWSTSSKEEIYGQISALFE